MASKSFDFRSLNKYLSAKGADDLNRFLEKLPQNSGKTALLAGGIAWGVVAALGLISMLQTQKLIELRGELQATESLQPIIPVITMAPAATEEVKAFADKAKDLYPGLIVSATANNLKIQSKDTASYAQFREIMGHVVSGGAGWKVSVNSMCVGRECPQNAMDADLRIEKITINKPAIIEKPSESPTAAPAPADSKSAS